MTKELRTDWFMFVIAAGLALFGALMVYSASAMMAMKESGESSQYTYFVKQSIFVIVGLAAMFVVSRIDYHVFENKWVIIGILAITSIALLAVFAFPPINGAQRWIRFGGFSFQPSELAKIALPMFLAWFLTKNEDSVTEVKSTVLPALGGFGLLAGLVMLEKDLGTTIVLCAIFSAVYFTAGARLMHIGTVAAGLVVIGAGAIFFAPWRVARIMAFLDPYKYSDDEAYQVVQSLYAIGSGGIFGEGFAKGTQKLFYLPYPYSDFIFSVVGEELGLVGTMAVVVVFGLLLWRGARAALMAPDRFGTLLGIGLITGIIAQALFNISVVISILPAKGIPLPFISYGGSSVLITLIGVGILLSISRHAGNTPKKEPANGLGSYRRRTRAA
ncbi:MAG: putative lipid II flippase FtsW [Acidobacteria bacterium]|nr:putative lipid II flippase FtsW [Acidobacteriota bacterium]MBK7935181.1 putative lipid II flippase FtsW [Acidobacteriota bacterium]